MPTADEVARYFATQVAKTASTRQLCSHANVHSATSCRLVDPCPPSSWWCPPAEAKDRRRARRGCDGTSSSPHLKHHHPRSQRPIHHHHPRSKSSDHPHARCRCHYHSPLGLRHPSDRRSSPQHNHLQRSSASPEGHRHCRHRKSLGSRHRHHSHFQYPQSALRRQRPHLPWCLSSSSSGRWGHPRRGRHERRRQRRWWRARLGGGVDDPARADRHRFCSSSYHDDSPRPPSCCLLVGDNHRQ